MSIVMSDSELIWIYIPVPKDATAGEVEKWMRDNAYTVAIQFAQRRDAQKEVDALMETDEGTMVQ